MYVNIVHIYEQVKSKMRFDIIVRSNYKNSEILDPPKADDFFFSTADGFNRCFAAEYFILHKFLRGSYGQVSYTGNADP